MSTEINKIIIFHEITTLYAFKSVYES